jgi:hypothetical protein
MLLDRTKIPATITTHEQLIAWCGLCIRFNITGTGVTQTFVRSAQDSEPTRLIDAGIFKDAAGDDRIAVLAYPSISPLWQGSAQKPWEFVQPLSTSAQAAMFNV